MFRSSSVFLLCVLLESGTKRREKLMCRVGVPRCVRARVLLCSMSAVGRSILMTFFLFVVKGCASTSTPAGLVGYPAVAALALVSMLWRLASFKRSKTRQRGRCSLSLHRSLVCLPRFDPPPPRSPQDCRSMPTSVASDEQKNQQPSQLCEWRSKVEERAAAVFLQRRQ